MSNYDSKYQLYCSKRINTARDCALSKEVTKAVRDIRFDDDIWNVNWRGTTFSVRPFLCSALSFLHIDEILDLLCDSVISSDEDFYSKLLRMKSSDYYDVFTDFENDMFSSILYQFHSQIPCVARYLVGLNDPTITKRLMFLVIREFSMMYSNKESYVEFYNPDICNTEAFSYYISIFWVLQKSKRLQFVLRKEINTLDLPKLLDILCPESSLHSKCLVGEVSSEDLLKEYTDSLVCEEVCNLFSGRNDVYKESDIKEIVLDLIGALNFNFGYESFVRLMACSYITMGYYSSDKALSDRLKSTCADLESTTNKIKQENRTLKSKLKGSEKECSKLSSDIESLVQKFDDSYYTSKIEALKTRESELSLKVLQLEKDLAKKEKDLIESKQTIRTQIKEIKSLNARLDESNDITTEKQEEVPKIEEELSVEEMTKQLMGYKIGIFGGFDAGCIVEKFNDYNLSVKHVIDEASFDVGDLDCAVILTTNIQHKTVRHLKSKYNGSLIYVNGTNIKYMIKKLYEKLILEVC